MPKYDGTGPLGAGPGTGWGMGPCMRGMRRGARRFYTKQEEREILEEEIKNLEGELNAVKERLSEIKD